MRHLQTLDTKKSRGNGKAQICAMRPGADVGLQIPAPHMPKARASSAGNRRGAGDMGWEVVTRTKEKWGLM